MLSEKLLRHSASDILVFKLKTFSTFVQSHHILHLYLASKLQLRPTAAELQCHKSGSASNGGIQCQGLDWLFLRLAFSTNLII